MNLNAAQNEFLGQLRVLSKELGVEITEIAVKENVYLTGKISDYQFWFYDGGDADFLSDWYDRRFEIAGFKTQQDLNVQFLESLRDAINRKDFLRERPDRSPTPLFNRIFDWVRDLWKNPNHEKKN